MFIMGFRIGNTYVSTMRSSMSVRTCFVIHVDTPCNISMPLFMYLEFMMFNQSICSVGTSKRREDYIDDSLSGGRPRSRSLTLAIAAMERLVKCVKPSRI